MVAEEVRRLAQRSASAARDTSAKIARSIELTQQGVQTSGEAAKALSVIGDGISKAAAVVSDIAAASQEQERDITPLTKASGKLDRATQSNSATAEKSATASQELLSQMQSTQTIVLQLSRIVGR